MQSTEITANVIPDFSEGSGILPPCVALSAWPVVRRKLDQLDALIALDDLKVPPGNRLESLTGKRKGQYSIRINEQYRICFVWTESGPDRVEVTDYH